MFSFYRCSGKCGKYLIALQTDLPTVEVSLQGSGFVCTPNPGPGTTNPNPGIELHIVKEQSDTKISNLPASVSDVLEQSPGPFTLDRIGYDTDVFKDILKGSFWYFEF